ncbi:MAG: CoA pyrophosphatase, partial [Desulfobacterales bacterium]|nr:CoA pyrophosphatase [Desulfobacterales bacterium]
MPSDPDIQLFEEYLTCHRPVRLPGKSFLTRACTAILIRGTGIDIELLFIRRAIRQGDPWSGHVGLPGGKMDDSDDSGRSAAIRELMEETGIDIRSCGSYLGRLSDLLTRSHNNRRPMIVTPYIFFVNGSEPALKIKADEVDHIFTVPLSFFLDKRNRQSFPYPVRGRRFNLPCYVYEGRRIWGLTLM